MLAIDYTRREQDSPREVGFLEYFAMPILDPQDSTEPLKSMVIEARSIDHGDSTTEGRTGRKASFGSVIGDLSEADKEVLERICRLLADHLGSDTAAIAWLNSPSTGYPGTAFEAIGRGHAALVLEDVESQWGPGPPYA